MRQKQLSWRSVALGQEQNKGSHRTSISHQIAADRGRFGAQGSAPPAGSSIFVCTKGKFNRRRRCSEFAPAVGNALNTLEGKPLLQTRKIHPSGPRSSYKSWFCRFFLSGEIKKNIIYLFFSFFFSYFNWNGCPDRFSARYFFRKAPPQ